MCKFTVAIWKVICGTLLSQKLKRIGEGGRPDVYQNDKT
jgi:hypothetical protein